MPKPAITRVSSMVVDPNYNDLNLPANEGFFLPQLTTTQISQIAAPTLQNGGLVYNITTNQAQLRQNGAWTALETSLTFTAPSYATVAAPAVADGIIYYDTTTNQLVAGVGANAAYTNVYTTPLTGLGSLVINSTAGDPAAVQGATSFNTATNALRTYNNGALNTVLTVNIAGNGANTLGNSTLVGGAVTVATTAVPAGAHIFLQTRGNVGTGNSGNVYVSAIVANTSFTITSANGADTSIVDWFIAKG